jgi:hypothetical protein
MGDGCIPFLTANAAGAETVEKMRAVAQGAGRNPKDIKIERMIQLRQGAPEDWIKEIAILRDMGVSYISCVTMNAGFATPAEHIKAIERFREVVADFVD